MRFITYFMQQKRGTMKCVAYSIGKSTNGVSQRKVAENVHGMMCSMKCNCEAQPPSIELKGNSNIRDNTCIIQHI